MHLCLNRALDKALTLNNWSCGLDPHLNPSLSSTQRAERDKMIMYAINDVFAPTHLYFHLRRTTPSSSTTLPSRTHSTTSFSSSSSTSTTRTASTTPFSSTPASPSSTILQSVTSPPLIVVVSDSHFKFLPSNFISNTYRLSTYVRSGLSWYNPYDSDLCGTTLLRSNLLLSTLSSAVAIFLFIGTNSLRSFPASSVIEQVQSVVSYLRSTHPHLASRHAITINLTFPCVKPTKPFSTIHDLSTNITTYNHMLTSLSTSNVFSILQFPISLHHLDAHGVHIDPHFNPLLSDTLYQHISRLIPLLLQPYSHQLPPPFVPVIETTPVIPPQSTSTFTSCINLPSLNQYVHVEADVVDLDIQPGDALEPITSTQHELINPPPASKSSQRSAAAKYRRNKKRHEQLQQHYKEHPLRRYVHSAWSIPDIKDFLYKSNIPFGCVNPRRGTLVTILFRDEEQRQYADAHLSSDIFDEFHHTQWTIKQLTN